MNTPNQDWLRAGILTSCLVLLISAGAGAELGYTFLFTMFIVICGGSALLYSLFPGSLFFSICLANCLAVYACIFILLIENNFANASHPAVQIGFALPVIAFLSGTLLHRKTIQKIVSSRSLRQLSATAKELTWLYVPMIIIAAASFAIPRLGLGENGTDLTLLAMMLVISASIFILSPTVSSFLLNTGLAFEQLFERIGRILIPAFAFLTFYALTVILFACIFRIVHRYLPGAHFNFNGAPHEISFSESLYFSLVSMSTLGYGDITPASGLLRLLVMIEVVVGVLLTLFGFSEIMRYSQEKAADDKSTDDQA